MIKTFVFNSLRLVYDFYSKNLLPFQFRISDLNYQSNTKDKNQTLKKKIKIRIQRHKGDERNQCPYAINFPLHLFHIKLKRFSLSL